MRNKQTVIIAEVALMVAFAVVLGLISILKMQNGGSLNLAMLPIVIISVRRGWKTGVVTGIVYGVVNSIIDGYIVFMPEYILGFGVIGLSGFFRKNDIQIILGTLASCVLRWMVHVIFGMVVFKANFEGSFIYNTPYMLGSTIAVLAVLAILLTRKEVLFELDFVETNKSYNESRVVMFMVIYGLLAISVLILPVIKDGSGFIGNFESAIIKKDLYIYFAKNVEWDMLGEFTLKYGIGLITLVLALGFGFITYLGFTKFKFNYGLVLSTALFGVLTFGMLFTGIKSKNFFDALGKAFSSIDRLGVAFYFSLVTFIGLITVLIKQKKLFNK